MKRKLILIGVFVVLAVLFFCYAPYGRKAYVYATTYTTAVLNNGTANVFTSTLDGPSPVTIVCASTGTFNFATSISSQQGSTATGSGYYYNQNSTAGNACTGTLPPTVQGLSFCVRNSIVSGTGAPDTGVLTVYPPSGSYVILAGVINTIGGGGTHGVASGGAAADAACFVAIDSTHWDVWPISGTWAAN